MNPELKRILDKHAGPRCQKCGTHGALADGSCPFPSDDEIVSALVAAIVEEFSTRDAQALVRLFCTEGPAIALELHEALSAPGED